MAKQMSFSADEKTLKLIDELMDDLGVTNRSQVLRKALALTKIAADKSRETNHVVTIGGDGREDEAVNVMLNA